MHRGSRRAVSLGIAALIVAAGLVMTRCAVLMPGDSYKGPLPLLEPGQASEAEQMRHDVGVLAAEIGERNVQHARQLAAAENFLAASLAKAGYRVEWQTLEVDGVACSNLIAELRGTGRDGEIVVVGAHYDSAPGCPAADDNASGCAGTLALARAFAGKPQKRTVRFVLFVNEEPPYFWTDNMGSLVYARACKRRGEGIVGMLSLETIGCYSDKAGSQSYPPPMSLAYPSTGNFIGFVGMAESDAFVKECVGAFRASAPFPSEDAALTAFVPRVGASDHWSFWKQGYPAAMVTDTAPYRNRNYHKPTDTADTLDYERMARVVTGLEGVIKTLASPGVPGEK